MYIIVGLGNPGPRYAGTRHNVGFDAVDVLAERYGISMSLNRFQAVCGKGIIEGEAVFLMKPMTYMNLSGDAVREAMQFFKLERDHLIVCYDDISLDVGKIRIREKGSAGGHNGIKHIIARLGSMEFPRVKIGVGDKPPRMDLADWVLSRFAPADCEAIDDAVERAASACVSLMTETVQQAMNRFNG